MEKKTRNWTIIGVTAAALIGGAFTVQAVADSRTYQHFKLATSEGMSTHGMFHKAGYRRGFGGEHFANMSDEEIEKRVNRIVRHVAIEIDATDEQTKKITAIVVGVAKDVKPLRSQFKATGKEIHDLLLKETIDRAKMEELRAKRFADADAISQNMVTALADIAEVLTPEQRIKLEKRVEEFRGKRRWFRGWHRG